MTDDFPPLSEYVLAVKCPQCGAAPGRLCWGPHVKRYDAAERRRQKDISAAPWPEDRVPGHDYSTIRIKTLEQAVLAVRCGTCRAFSGQPCTKPGGGSHRSRELKGARLFAR